MSDQVQELIAGYVLGDLSPDESLELERLLIDYPELTHEIATVQQVLELSYALPEETPPASLRAKVLAASLPLAAAQSNSLQLEALRYWEQRSPSRWQVWGRAAGIAAAVLIVTLGIANYRLRQDLQALKPDSSGTPAVGTSLAYTLEGTDVARNATARVVVDPATLEAVLTVEDLPPLPSGKVYVLWTVVEKNAPFTTDQKGAILTQVFRVNEQGNFSEAIAVPAPYRTANVVTRLAVTLEDASAPQAHQGAIALTTRS